MNWDVLSPFFKYPGEIRSIMYTTNIIEGIHRQFRKVTKTKSVFAGSILFVTDASHVGLITYGDGSKIYYADHSSTKKVVEKPY